MLETGRSSPSWNCLRIGWWNDSAVDDVHAKGFDLGKLGSGQDLGNVALGPVLQAKVSSYLGLSLLPHNAYPTE